jgi:hypothetical protein
LVDDEDDRLGTLHLSSHNGCFEKRATDFCKSVTYVLDPRVGDQDPECWDRRVPE